MTKYKTLCEYIIDKYYLGLYNYPEHDYEITDQVIAEILGFTNSKNDETY